METPERIEGDEMPSRPMNSEPPQATPTQGDQAPSRQEGEMPTRAMAEPEPSTPPRTLSPREQDKLAAYQRDQSARAEAAAGKNKMPTGA